MPAGLPVQIGDINITAGDICRAVTHHLQRAMAMKLFLDRFSSAQLVSAYGFTQGDADIIKSAFAQLATIDVSFQANRTFINQLTGMGDV